MNTSANMDTSKNMDKSTYMSGNILSIMINSAYFQETWLAPAPHVNSHYILYNILVYTNDDNTTTPMFHPDAVPYEDNIPEIDIFYEK